MRTTTLRLARLLPILRVAFLRATCLSEFPLQLICERIEFRLRELELLRVIT